MMIRLPRFCVTTRSHGLVFIVPHQQPELRLAVELLDFSRFGAGVHSHRALPVGDAASLQIHDPQQNFMSSLDGKIRWCRAFDDTTWIFGIFFHEPVPFEICGELFLRGYLEAEERDPPVVPPLVLMPSLEHQ